jgi:hypothetical protein
MGEQRAEFNVLPGENRAFCVRMGQDENIQSVKCTGIRDGIADAANI